MRSGTAGHHIRAISVCLCEENIFSDITRAQKGLTVEWITWSICGRRAPFQGSSPHELSCTLVGTLARGFLSRRAASERAIELEIPPIKRNNRRIARRNGQLQYVIVTFVRQVRSPHLDSDRAATMIMERSFPWPRRRRSPSCSRNARDRGEERYPSAPPSNDHAREPRDH
jgi:hypothetical protein